MKLQSREYRLGLVTNLDVLAAQNTSSALSGTVQDAAGAIIPNVKVTLTGEGNGFVRSVKTNDSGYFSFPDLMAAKYNLAVVAAGFKRYEQKGIALNSGDQRSLGTLTLAVGEVTESVTITAEAAPVQLGSSEKAGVLTGEEIDSMALRGRDFFDAIGLVAGALMLPTSRFKGLAVPVCSVKAGPEAKAGGTAPSISPAANSTSAAGRASRFQARGGCV